MSASEIIEQLEELGGESSKRILMNHGAKEPVLGVKIADLKKIQKQHKNDYPLALELFDTGIYDAQYLAGLMTDPAQMTKKDLRHWVSKANSPPISSTIVAWVAAESPHGIEMSLKWIEAKKAATAETGWMTLSSLVAIKSDEDLEPIPLKQLLNRVEKTIHDQPNLVRYAMNTFLMCTGCYVSSLTEECLKVAEKIGVVSVDMGNTACQVPSAADMIHKVQKRGTIGKKKKMARC